MRIGFALTGSFCTFSNTVPFIIGLKELGYDIVPIMSDNVYNIDTRFGSALSWRSRIEDITGREILHTLPQVEPIGPDKLLDVLVIAPCTGNTIAKLANGITDTPVVMACKSQWRNQRPVVIGISTNDGLGINLKNIAVLLASKDTFFIPFGQDKPFEKPKSLVADWSLLPSTIEAASMNQQLQPLLLTY